MPSCRFKGEINPLLSYIKLKYNSVYNLFETLFDLVLQLEPLLSRCLVAKFIRTNKKNLLLYPS